MTGKVIAAKDVSIGIQPWVEHCTDFPLLGGPTIWEERSPAVIFSHRLSQQHSAGMLCRNHPRDPGRRRPVHPPVRG